MDSNSSDHIVAKNASAEQISDQAVNGGVITGMDPAMYKAAANGEIEALKEFSVHELEVQLTPKHNTPLHIAAQFGQLVLGSAELQQNLNMDSNSIDQDVPKDASRCPTRLNYKQLWCGNDSGISPLYMAVEGGFANID